MPSPLGRRALVLFCGLAAAGCATTIEVRPDMVPAIAAAARRGDKIRGVVGDPRSRPVEIDGFLDAITVERRGPGAPLDDYEAPLDAGIVGGRLGLMSAGKKRFYLPAEIARVEVTTSNIHASRRAAGITLIVLSALSIGAAAITRATLPTSGSPNPQAVVTLPLVIGGVVFLGIGIPLVAKGYDEPRQVSPINLAPAQRR